MCGTHIFLCDETHPTIYASRDNIQDGLHPHIGMAVAFTLIQPRKGQKYPVALNVRQAG